MNKIKNLFVIILFALVAFSCSDILDKGPLDKYSENDVWKSTDLTQAFIYTALANATNMMVWKDNWTDNEAIMEDGRDVNAELIDRYYDAGWNKYEDIRRCNMVLARVPEAPFTNAEKANFIALKIVDLNVKIYNTLVLRIKEEVREYLTSRMY